MGKDLFSNLTKFFALALLVAATALAAIAVLSSPATSQNDPPQLNDGNNYNSTKSWDTDNLRYGLYKAKSFNIPFHDYGGYSGVAACQSGVADAFFQAGGTVGAVNDFPYLDWDNDSGSWVEKESGARNDGCDEFVAQQDKMATRIVSDGGFSH